MSRDRLAERQECTCGNEAEENPAWHEATCFRRMWREAEELAAEAAEGWHKLKPTGDAGGYRDFVDGQPVHCGAALELRIVEYHYDRATERDVVRKLDKGTPVRYEIAHRQGKDGRVVRVPMLHASVGGHEFKAEANAAMRFRWPVRP